MINELGQTLFERAKQERGATRAEARTALLRRAVDAFDRTLAIDAENVTAHYALSLLHGELGNPAQAAVHARPTCATRPTSSRAAASSPCTGWPTRRPITPPRRS